MCKNSIAIFIFLLFSTISFSQNTITIKGKVVDASEKLPLESATIYITSAKDSTVIDYTISNRNGNFEIKTRGITQPVFLKISFMGFQDYKQQLNSVTEDIDFGTITMVENTTMLNEVVIESEIPPIRIKSDTLEFNASSFKVRPDANVEALLKQLPGVEVDTDGKITVNGKEVNQILVNGKPFFDKDGKIALQNLPSDIIDKVQVTDTKTKAEEISGQKASGNNASINLTIQEDKNKGLFGKFMGGYGSDERYESSAIINYFKGKRKLSFLGSSNNINSTGFSMNEIFDSMRGGRNNSISNFGNGSFNINGIQFGGGNGITQSNIAGLNYADEWFKGFDSNASYFYTSANTDNDNRTRQTTFLPNDANDVDSITKSFTTESNSKTNSDTYAHNFNTQFEFKIDSTSTLFFEPKLIKANTKFKNNSSQFSVNENNELLNESIADRFSETENTTFSNNLEYFKSFKRKGRTISFSFNNENRKDDVTDQNISTTTSYFDNNGNQEEILDIRNQVRHNRQTRDNYTAAVNYVEPVIDSLRVKVGVQYNRQQSVEDRVGYDFDEASQQYSNRNDLLTNYLTSKTNTINPNAGVYIEKEKINVGITLGTAITKFDNYSLYLGNETNLSKEYLLPSAKAYLNYKFTKSKSIWASYNYSVDFPSPSQILPVEDLTDPLFTYVGNAELNPNKYHYAYFSFRDYDYATRSGYTAYGGGSFYDSQIISSTIFDESAKRITTYENISGTYQGWLGINWNKSIKREAHRFRFGVGISSGFGLSKGYTNQQLYDAKSIRLSPRVNFTWDYGELLSINPTYNFTYSETNYTNYNISSASNFIHRFNLQTTTYWPNNLVFGNDFGYTYNSNIADGFKKDFYLWNTSLGYNFLQKTLLFKVKIYDVLNQNLSTTRTISPETIRDEQNTVLKRYVMFSLTYKLEKFGGKEKKGREFFMN